MANLPSLSDLLAAYQTPGAGDAVNSLTAGATKGFGMAQDMQARKQQFQQKLQEMGILQQKNDIEQQKNQNELVPNEAINKVYGQDIFPAGGKSPFQAYDSTVRAKGQKDQKSAMDTMHMDDQDAKDAQSMSKNLDIGKLRLNTLFGQAENSVNTADKLRRNMDGFFDHQSGTFNVPPSYYTDFALDYARLLAPNAQAGVELVNHLKQPSTKEELAKVLSFVSSKFRNQPLGSEPDDVMRKLSDQVNELGLTAEQQRDNYASGYAKGAGYKRLHDRNPAYFNDALQALNMTPFSQHVNASPSSQWKPSGQPTQSTSAQSSSAPAQEPAFTDEASAHAANLPKGTVVRIGGRRARID